jgi:hypothetical protein
MPRRSSRVAGKFTAHSFLYFSQVKHEQGDHVPCVVVPPADAPCLWTARGFCSLRLEDPAEPRITLGAPGVEARKDRKGRWGLFATRDFPGQAPLALVTGEVVAPGEEPDPVRRTISFIGESGTHTRVQLASGEEVIHLIHTTNGSHKFVGLGSLARDAFPCEPEEKTVNVKFSCDEQSSNPSEWARGVRAGAGPAERDLALWLVTTKPVSKGDELMFRRLGDERWWDLRFPMAFNRTSSHKFQHYERARSLVSEFAGWWVRPDCPHGNLLTSNRPTLEFLVEGWRLVGFTVDEIRQRGPTCGQGSTTFGWKTIQLVQETSPALATSRQWIQPDDYRVEIVPLHNHNEVCTGCFPAGKPVPRVRSWLMTVEAGAGLGSRIGELTGPRVAVRNSDPDRGAGLFATAKIEKGRLITTYPVHDARNIAPADREEAYAIEIPREDGKARPMYGYTRDGLQEIARLGTQGLELGLGSMVNDPFPFAERANGEFQAYGNFVPTRSPGRDDRVLWWSPLDDYHDPLSTGLVAVVATRSIQPGDEILVQYSTDDSYWKTASVVSTVLAAPITLHRPLPSNEEYLQTWDVRCRQDVAFWEKQPAGFLLTEICGTWHMDDECSYMSSIDKLYKATYGKQTWWFNPSFMALDADPNTYPGVGVGAELLFSDYYLETWEEKKAGRWQSLLEGMIGTFIPPNALSLQHVPLRMANQMCIQCAKGHSLDDKSRLFLPTTTFEKSEEE